MPPSPSTVAPVPRTYHAAHVVVAVLVCYLVMVMFDAKGIYGWTTKMPVSDTATALKHAANKHWRKTARLGLEEPKFTLETLFLDAQEANPLLYPKKYAVIEQRRKDKAAAKAKAAADKIGRAHV